MNGVSLDHVIEGSGPTVVLVHGSWADRYTWVPVTSLFVGHCRVASYDRRGHSRSERPPGQGSVHEDVADLAALVETLDLAPVFVCGNSFGGLVALRLAHTRPDLVRGVAAHEPPGTGLLAGPDLADATARMSPVRALLEAGEDAAAAELFVEMVALGPGGWALLPPRVRETFVHNAPTHLDELRDPDAFGLDLDALASYTGPVLLSHSDDSPPMFAPILDRIAAALPQSVRHVYAGAGHVPHVTRPEEYARVTLPWVLGSYGRGTA